MDDRFSSAKIGAPIPRWDSQHRLPISGWAGPDCQDGATTFRINSTYMDVTEQCHMVRQWYAGSVLMAAFMALPVGIALLGMFNVSMKRGLPIPDIFVLLLMAGIMSGLIFYCFRFGKEEFFAKTRYPIRFNRKERKIYALVRAQTGRKGSDGAIVEEIEWRDSSIFCIHRAEHDGYHYCIRYYRLDQHGNVEKSVAIGRDWDEMEGLQELLAQWNYWSWYMNQGPEGLPSPGIFLPEVESARESFLYCMYEMGFKMNPTLRVILLPVFALLAFCRIVSVWSCKAPQWPVQVSDKSVVEPGDPFDEPRGSTPIGWYETLLAVENKSFPELQVVKVQGWPGEPDGLKNAAIWASDNPSHKPRIDQNVSE